MPTAVANYGSDNLIVSSFSYTYRGDGNIASERDHNNVTTTYTYDLLGRLVSEVGGYSRYYSYDAAGNRTQAIVDTATTISYTYDSDGRLVSEISNNGSSLLTTSYAYDSNGSLISENDGDVTSYTYDVWGNMTSAGNASYAYNAQGLRVSKTVNGVTDNFVLVGGDVWKDSENTYLRGFELISSSDYFYLYNIRGDVIQLLNYSGEVVKMYDYDAYGNELNRDLSDENPFRYCGEYYDTETGLIYLRARYYDPSIGRFTSVDPIKDGLNWYAYCYNNPINFIDPSGLRFVGALHDTRMRLLNSASGNSALNKDEHTAGYLEEDDSADDYFAIKADKNQTKSEEVDNPEQDSKDDSLMAGDLKEIVKNPPSHPNYKPPKKGDKRVKNPNGYGFGWQADDGGVWVWTPDMHGDPGWTVQYPDGSHWHAYPDGGTRSHKNNRQPSTISSLFCIVGASIGLVLLLADNITLIGATNDALAMVCVTIIIDRIAEINGNYDT